MTDMPYPTVCEAAAPDLAEGESFEVPNPLRGRTWTDERGVAWRRRGQEVLTPNRARKVLARPGVTVMHVYLGMPHEHAGRNLSGLLAEVEKVWAGDEHDPMHTFDIAEFRDEDGRVMVMIAESC